MITTVRLPWRRWSLKWHFFPSKVKSTRAGWGRGRATSDPWALNTTTTTTRAAPLNSMGGTGDDFQNLSRSLSFLASSLFFPFTHFVFFPLSLIFHVYVPLFLPLPFSPSLCLALSVSHLSFLSFSFLYCSSSSCLSLSPLYLSISLCHVLPLYSLSMTEWGKSNKWWRGYTCMHICVIRPCSWTELKLSEALKSCVK